MIDTNEVADRVAQIRADITSAGGSDVSLVAVTKSFGVDAIRAAALAGCDAVGENVALWQSVDRESVIDELSRRAIGASILIQVDTTGERSKGGIDLSEIDSMRQRAEKAGLHVAGLMTIGPTDGSQAECEKSFRLLRELVNQQALAVCSMGMSADFSIAVACGSTMVRVGSALFGSRPIMN